MMMEENKVYTNLFEEIRTKQNAGESLKMEQYLRHQFKFLGIRKPELKEYIASFLKEEKKKKKICWSFVDDCFSKDEREYHYIGIEYLRTLKKFMTIEDIEHVERYILWHSWWDSVDALLILVEYLIVQYPELKETHIKCYAHSENYWLKRVSILCQLHLKEKTDVELLSYTILENTHTNEFFVNKAIGWALRSYSRTNPEYVRIFLQTYELCLVPLSRREASKYI